MRTRLFPALLLALALMATACGGTPTATDDPTADPPTTSAPDDDQTSPPDDPTDDTEPTTDPVAADCSTQGRSTTGADLDGVSPAARDAAAFLLDAAVRCDEQLLATAAEEDRTSLSFGGSTPYEAFALPDGDERYVALVTLLTELPHAEQTGSDGSMTYVWPRVHSAEWVDSDAAWAEVADSGLHPQELLQQMREGGSGYLGWRLGIGDDGTWRFLIAGD